MSGLAPRPDNSHSDERANDVPPFISDLSEISAVRGYLRRIGATARSLVCAAVQEQEGNYLRDVATVRLDPKTGDVTVLVANGSDSSPYEPSDFERRDIVHQVNQVKWPEQVRLVSKINLPDEVRSADRQDVFEFLDEDGKIIMLLLRVDNAGGKSYFPYTYWTDQKWRRIEPDGLLPLWGIDQLRLNATVVLHEGAKAACFARGIIADTREGRAKLAAHPWGQQLIMMAHVGWIGGAFAAARTDWSVLQKFGVKHVVIVADNDLPGDAAVTKISKLLSGYDIVVDAIRFDSRFPRGFDLADKFPDNLFETGADGVPRYSGPSYADTLQPATWATTITAAPAQSGPGRPSKATARLRPQFSQRWIMVAGEGKPLFVSLHDPSRLYTEEGFNTLVRPFSDAERTSNLFKQQAYPSHVSNIVYEPGDEQGIIIVESVRSINTWVPPSIRSFAGDPQPFLDFMTYLIPDAGDRQHALRWCATLIACPRVRMKYGLLLASTMQGVGKTTLCEILRILVGPQNCSAPSAKDVVESAFNSWLVRKRLVFVNEIYEGSNWKSSQRLKSFITDQTLEANEKMIRGYSIKNWAHFILCSNADVPIKLDKDDRRFLVPQVTEIKRSQAEWEAFYAWLAGGGYGITAAWSNDFAQKFGHVGAGDEAPLSTRKQHLIEDSQSAEERAVTDLAIMLMNQTRLEGGQAVLVVDDVVDWLSHQSRNQFKSVTIRRWLEKAGLYASSDRLKVRDRMTHVVGTAPIGSKGWPELQAYRQMPDNLDRIEPI